MFENVKVRDFMTETVITTQPNTPISHAHQVMRENNIRRLPVVDNQRLVGLVTIGDVREASPSDATTLSIWELNYLWSQLVVEKVMTRNVYTVTPETSILDVAELMLEHKISGLPVVDSQDNLVGMITESDVFRMLVRSKANTGTL
ncbi:MAG: CBS domain-containing protein [Chloroflexota bacterium]